MRYRNPYIEMCLEGQTSALKGLSQKEKETIAQHHSFEILNKGEYLFREGEKSKGLVCLAAGKVKVFKIGVGGREQILKLVRDKEFIGYNSVFSEIVWPVSARAIEDSAICIFDRTYFLRVLKKNAGLALKFMQILSEELNLSCRRIVSLTQKHLRGRLAESLLMLSDIYGYEEDGKTISASLSREDIASLSNMTTSNAIRTLSTLVSEGNIKINGRKISLIETSRLQQMSAQG